MTQPEQLVTMALYALAVERATELLTASKIFAPVRATISTTAYPPGSPPLGPPEPAAWARSLAAWARSAGKAPHPFSNAKRRAAKFFNEMLGCGYCTSVWVSMPFAAGLASETAGWVTYVLVLHGLSNLYHVVYELVRKGRVLTIDVSHTGSVSLGAQSVEPVELEDVTPDDLPYRPGGEGVGDV